MEHAAKKASGSGSVARKKRQWWWTTLMIVLMCAWVAISVVATQFVVGIIMIRILGTAQFNKPVWTAIYSAISYSLALLLVVFVPILLNKRFRTRNKNTPPAKKQSVHRKNLERKLSVAEQRMELGLMGMPTWSDIGLAPIGFVASLLLAAVLVGIFTAFPWFDAEQVQNVGFNAYMVGRDRVIAFLTLVIMAPIAEEIIFRGWLYGKMRNQLLERIPEWLGIIISTLVVSILFGVIHMQWNVGVNVFALSVVLCVLREITGTIYAGILTHMIKNGVAFFLLYVVGMG